MIKKFKKHFKLVLKSLTPPLIWSALKFLLLLKKSKNQISNQPVPAEHIEQTEFFGVNQLDKTLLDYLNFEEGYFVELGANDGINQSNTFHLEKFKGWKGVLVEPIPHNFLNCLKIRSQKTHVFSNACVSFEYHEKFVEIQYSNLMSVSLNLESDISDPISHANLGKQFLSESEKVFTFGAVARTLQSILEEARSPSLIDLLSLDVEGSEIEVLKGINHDKYKFKYICIECRDINKMEKYLNSKGYRLIKQLSVHDFLFENAMQ